MYADIHRHAQRYAERHANIHMLTGLEKSFTYVEWERLHQFTFK